MAGLFLIGDSTFNSLAIGSIVVVAVAVLGSITVLPALLAKLGRWVDRPRVPLLHRVDATDGPRGAISGRILGPVTRHPLVALGLSGGRGRAAGGPGARHEDAQRQPRDAADLDPRGADDARPERGVPVRGHHRRPRRPRHGRPAGRGGRRAGEVGGRRPTRPTLFRSTGEPVRGLGGRPDLGAHAGHPVRRVRRPGRHRDPRAALRPGAAGAGRAGRRVRRRRRRRGVAGLRGPPAGAAAAA